MKKRILVSMLALGVGCLLGPAALCEAPPDSDGDGISDLEDQCPQTWGRRASPFGAGCPMAQDANGNWCGPDEHSVNGVCVPVEDTTVTEPPPPPPDAGDEFCSNPGNWSHPTCGGSSSTDDDNDGSGSSGGGAGSGGGSGGNYGEQLDDNATDAAEKIKACVVTHSIDSVIHQYWPTVQIRYVDFDTEFSQYPDLSSSLGAAGCNHAGNKHVIYLDRANLESTHSNHEAVGWTLTIWDVVASTLVHEFLHVMTYEVYGCTPWTNSVYAGILRAAGFDATRDGNNEYISELTIREFKEIFGVDSYRSGDFGNHNGSEEDSLGCTKGN